MIALPLYKLSALFAISILFMQVNKQCRLFSLLRKLSLSVGVYLLNWILHIYS